MPPKNKVKAAVVRRKTQAKARFVPCVEKELPEKLQVEAARIAAAENPANAPAPKALAAIKTMEDQTPPATRIAVLTGKYWKPGELADVPVQFLDTPDAETKRLILEAANVLGQSANIKFRETNQTGMVRVARTPDDGHYSYVGYDNKLVQAGQKTMNLDSFTARTPPSEYRRVVPHEFLHFCGCPHEHMRRALIAKLHIEKTITYFMKTQGWSRQEVIAQVLTPLEESALIATPEAGEDSIMTYSVPGSVTMSGKPVVGGSKVTTTDAAFLAKLHPKPAAPAGGAVLSVDLDNKTVVLPEGWTVKK